MGYLFRGYAGSQLLRPARLLASPDGSDWYKRPATGGFCVQAFDGAVALTVAGYNYDIDWTPMSAGLTPAGMAASFAAPLPQIADIDFSRVDFSVGPGADLQDVHLSFARLFRRTNPLYTGRCIRPFFAIPIRTKRRAR